MSNGEVCFNCGHQRDDGDAGPLGVCPKCEMPYAWGPAAKARVQPRPAALREKSIESSDEAEEAGAPIASSRDDSSGQIEACAASGLLALGCFAPLVTLPIVGSLNYIGNGSRDGVAVIVLAAISVVLALKGRVRDLLVTGTLSALIIAAGLYKLSSNLGAAKAQAERASSGAFGAIAQAMSESVQLQWGWVLLVTGAALTIAVGAGFRFPRR